MTHFPAGACLRALRLSATFEDVRVSHAAKRKSSGAPARWARDRVLADGQEWDRADEARLPEGPALHFELPRRTAAALKDYLGETS